jgi:hypothetical protein
MVKVVKIMEVIPAASVPVSSAASFKYVFTAPTPVNP